MKIVDNKIMEITENELFTLYLDREMDDVMEFKEYRNRFLELGVKIIEKDESDV